MGACGRGRGDGGASARCGAAAATQLNRAVRCARAAAALLTTPFPLPSPPHSTALQGLLEPAAPKVKISNLMRVLGTEATAGACCAVLRALRMALVQGTAVGQGGTSARTPSRPACLPV